jgi:hypothetical protein
MSIAPWLRRWWPLIATGATALIMASAAIYLRYGTPASPSAAASSAVPAAQPTLTSPAVTVAPPTTIAALPSPEASPTVAAGGILAWRSRVLPNDSVVVSANGLPAPDAGSVYVAWLANDQSALPLGPLTIGSDGAASLIYTAPNQENLLALYDRAYISRGQAAQATVDVGTIVLSGSLPPQALASIRQIIVQSEATPGQLGFALGLRQQSDELLRQAQFLEEGFERGDLAEERLFAERLVNIIEGDQGQHYGDLNGDGMIDTVGDGYGLLPGRDRPGYIRGTVDQAQLAAEAPDATEEIVMHAGHVQVAAENVRVRLTDVRDRALRIAQAPDAEATAQDVLHVMALLQQAINGIDLNLNERVDPLPGEGGVVTAFQHAQLMVSVPLNPGGEGHSQSVNR